MPSFVSVSRSPPTFWKPEMVIGPVVDANSSIAVAVSRKKPVLIRFFVSWLRGCFGLHWFTPDKIHPRKGSRR